MMKKTVYTITMLLLLTLGFQSCEDSEDIASPDFSVEFNQTVKAGEPITFNIPDAPNFLSFFSGESGSEYKNSTRLKTEGEFFLSFETARHYFDGSSRSDNAWNLLVSKDYSGSGTVEDVQVATWTDITDKFVFATARTYSPTTNSGTVNISEFSGEEPVYFAVKVLADGKKADGNRQGVFRFYSFDINLAVTGEDYSLVVASILSPGFKPVNVQGTHPSIAAKDVWINKGGYYELAADQAEYTNEDWLITNPVNLSGSVEPDRGQPLKTYSDKLDQFEYTYTTAGTYKVVFVGTNETIYGKKEVIKEYTITVTD